MYYFVFIFRCRWTRLRLNLLLENLFCWCDVTSFSPWRDKLFGTPGISTARAIPGPNSRYFWYFSAILAIFCTFRLLAIKNVEPKTLKKPRKNKNVSKEVKVKNNFTFFYSRRATPARYLALIIKAKKANAQVGVGAKEKVVMKKIQEILQMGIHKVKTKNEVDIQNLKIQLDIIWSKR